MSELRTLLLCLAGALSSSSAYATGWEQWGSGTADQTLLAVQSPDGKDVFVAGIQMDGASFPPTMSPRVFASSDVGHTFDDVTGSLSTLPFTAAEAVFFVDANRGWVGGGTKVWSTTDRGAHWSAGVDTGLGAVHALQFFDVKRGVVLGESSDVPAIKLTADGGKTWTATTPPAVTGSVGSTFWLDDQVGWAAGSSTKSVDDGSGNTYDAPDQGFVLSTHDGGATWTESNLVADYGLGPVHFLRDALTGWAAGYKQTDADHAEAALFKTTDGGKTFVDAKLPLEVGKISMMGFTGSLPLSYIHALFFADAKTGHLGGNAYIGNEQSGQGSPVKIFRTVDYWTHDGGATWQYTDLGTIDMSGTVTNDGTLAGGAMVSVNLGWMVGTNAAVWGYAPDTPVPCKTDDECAPGFGCNVFGKCQSVTCPDGCPVGTTCVFAVCRPPAVDDAGVALLDGGAPALDDAGNPIVVVPGDGGTQAGDGGSAVAAHDAGTAVAPARGCGCATGAGSPGALALLVVFWALVRRPGKVF